MALEFTLEIPALTMCRRTGRPKRYRMPPNANSRLFWRRKAEVDRWFRDQVRMLCREAGMPRGAGHVTVTFRNSSVREMDRDNMYSSAKTLVDALTARERGGNPKKGIPGESGWGLVPDDKEQYIDLKCVNVRVAHLADEKVELVVVVDKLAV